MGDVFASVLAGCFFFYFFFCSFLFWLITFFHKHFTVGVLDSILSMFALFLLTLSASLCFEFFRFVSQLGSWCPTFSGLCAFNSLFIYPARLRELSVGWWTDAVRDIYPARVIVMSVLVGYLCSQFFTRVSLVMFARVAPKFKKSTGSTSNIDLLFVSNSWGLRWYNFFRLKVPSV